MLRRSHVDSTMIETTHQYHAREYVAKMELTDVDMIATVSGDGLFNEVIEGSCVCVCVCASSACACASTLNISNEPFCTFGLNRTES
jgi:hypothetical protein